MDDRSLSAHCAAAGTCASPLLFNGLVNAANALTLEGGANASSAEVTIRLFGQAYSRAARLLGDDSGRDDLEGWRGLARADAVRCCKLTAEKVLYGSRTRYRISAIGVSHPDIGGGLQIFCAHPAALCELYAPLGKPLIVLLTARPDLGRTHSVTALRRWRDAIRWIASRPDTAVLANSAYDSAYADYFAGLRDVPVVPSLCRSSGSKWAWRPPQIGGGSGPPFLLDVCDDTRCPPFRQARRQCPRHFDSLFPMRITVVSGLSCLHRKLCLGNSSWRKTFLEGSRLLGPFDPCGKQGD